MSSTFLCLGFLFRSPKSGTSVTHSIRVVVFISVRRRKRHPCRQKYRSEWNLLLWIALKWYEKCWRRWECCIPRWKNTNVKWTYASGRRNRAVPKLMHLVAGFPPRRPGFGPRSDHVEFMVHRVILGQVFSKYFGFPCQFSIQWLLHCDNIVTHPGLVQEAR
jgi:hypothetical protein